MNETQPQGNISFSNNNNNNNNFTPTVQNPSTQQLLNANTIKKAKECINKLKSLTSLRRNVQSSTHPYSETIHYKVSKSESQLKKSMNKLETISNQSNLNLLKLKEQQNTFRNALKKMNTFENMVKENYSQEKPALTIDNGGNCYDLLNVNQESSEITPAGLKRFTNDFREALTMYKKNKEEFENKVNDHKKNYDKYLSMYFKKVLGLKLTLMKDIERKIENYNGNLVSSVHKMKSKMDKIITSLENLKTNTANNANAKSKYNNTISADYANVKNVQNSLINLYKTFTESNSRSIQNNIKQLEEFNKIFNKQITTNNRANLHMKKFNTYYKEFIQKNLPNENKLSNELKNAYNKPVEFRNRKENFSKDLTVKIEAFYNYYASLLQTRLDTLKKQIENYKKLCKNISNQINVLNKTIIESSNIVEIQSVKTKMTQLQEYVESSRNNMINVKECENIISKIKSLNQFNIIQNTRQPTLSNSEGEGVFQAPMNPSSNLNTNNSQESFDRTLDEKLGGNNKLKDKNELIFESLFSSTNRKNLLPNKLTFSELNKKAHKNIIEKIINKIDNLQGVRSITNIRSFQYPVGKYNKYIANLKTNNENTKLQFLQYGFNKREELKTYLTNLLQ